MPTDGLHRDADATADAASAERSPFHSTELLDASDRHRIVIVGGGAGGLELAARLGASLGAGDAEVVLVDEQLTHFWKPLLHEVAAGTLPPHANQADFLQQARRHRFRFHLGRLESLDRAQRRVWLAPLLDAGEREIAPRRSLHYDTLVVAVGSIVNDFGTPGVAEHAITLDDDDDARRFHRRLLAECARAEVHGEPVDIVIVGGGATGVELAAELREAVSEIASYGAVMSRMHTPVRITIVEMQPRLLGGLPADVAECARVDLQRRGMQVLLGQRVVEVCVGQVKLADGRVLTADLCAWAAGIQGPPLLRRFDGLELNRARQLVVRADLRTPRDAHVFALGDCASVEHEAEPVPATAQAAQQQAEYLARALADRLAGREVAPFRYRQRGVLVSLGSRGAVGSLTPGFGGQRWLIYGLVARLAYWALQRRHLAMLHGFGRAALMMLGGWLASRATPRVKLH